MTRRLPALVIAIASGVLVTKSRSEIPLSREIASQFILSPTALRIAGLMVLAFAAVPGLPGTPFAICLLYTSPSPRDGLLSRMPSSA